MVSFKYYIQRKFSWFFKAFSHYFSIFILRYYSRNNFIIFVCGPPRCGTSWVSDVLASYYNLPRPKHYFLPVLFESVIHTHVILNPNKYKEVVYVERDGLNAYVSWFRQIRDNIIERPNDPVLHKYKNLFVDIANKENDSDNIKRLIDYDVSRTDSTLKKMMKIDQYCIPQTSRLIIYEKALDNSLDEFSKVIESISGSCDKERLKLVIQLLDKNAQCNFLEKRRSTNINKLPSDYNFFLQPSVVHYFKSLQDKLKSKN